MSRRPSKYALTGRAVLEHARKGARQEIREELDGLIERLLRDPLPGSTAGNIQPLKVREFPAMYTVPFDRAVLAYQVTMDMPTVRLRYILWLEPPA